MNQNSYSETLRTLCKEYYQSQISFSEYRERRKVVLDDIDSEYNGYQVVPEESALSEDESLSLISKALDFLKPGVVDE